MTKEEARKLYLEMLERTKDIELPDGLLVGTPTEEYDSWLDEPWTEEEIESFANLDSEELEEWK